MGSIILVISIVIIIVACGNSQGEGFLSQARLNKTTERDPNQRRSQSKTDFRKHRGDKKRLLRAVQAFSCIFVMFLPKPNRTAFFTQL
jgi:hypothetical protein